MQQTIRASDVRITPKLRQWILACEQNKLHPQGNFSLEVLQREVTRAINAGLLDEDTFLELSKSKDDETMATKATLDRVFGGGGGRVNVQDESRKYVSQTYELKHPRLGSVINPATRRPCESMSLLDAAKAGCFLKQVAFKSGLVAGQLPENERALLDEMCETDAFVGKIGSTEYDLIRGAQVKALFDDSTSGGIEIAPIAFDANIVTFPLLTAELFPRVNVVDIPRGRRIEGGSISTPSVSWGQGDNVEVGLFDTTSLVAEINTTIHGVAVAVEIGRDFMSDAAVDVGSILTRLIGERLSAELDNVIAVGNGTNRPQGLTIASGITTTNTDNAGAGPPTLADYTELLFAVGKQYRTGGRTVFISNDTTYQRSRSIRVDPAVTSVDQRPVLADVNSFQNYMSLGVPHVIQNDIGNATCLFGRLDKYRLYRRAGLEIRFVDGGKELARKNLVLLIARARFGGRVMDSSAFSKWTDGQS